MGATEETVAAHERTAWARPARANPVFRLAFRRGDRRFWGFAVSGERVSEAITGRFMNTLFLAAYAAVIAVPLAIILGIIVALLRNTLFDRVANVLTLTSISSPEFFLGYI